MPRSALSIGPAGTNRHPSTRLAPYEPCRRRQKERVPPGAFIPCYCFGASRRASAVKGAFRNARACGSGAPLEPSRPFFSAVACRLWVERDFPSKTTVYGLSGTRNYGSKCPCRSCLVGWRSRFHRRSPGARRYCRTFASAPTNRARCFGADWHSDPSPRPGRED